MAYLQARSNIARAGVTYAGWSPPLVRLYVDGVDRTLNILGDEFELNLAADAPTLAFSVKGFTPTTGKDVALYFARPDEYLFAGTIVQIEAKPEGPGSAFLIWQVMAVDYRWLINRYDLVFATYRDLGINTIVHDILTRFTNGNFKKGRVSSALGNVSIQFRFETVQAALESLARLSNTYLEITPFRRVNLLGSSELAQVATLTQSQVLKGSLTYSEDLTQIRTRARMFATGAHIAELFSPVVGSMYIDDPTPFDDAGGTALAGEFLFTYTGIGSVLSGGVFPEPLTIRYYLAGVAGVAGVGWPLAAGTEVVPLVTAVDSAAQTALASRLGGGLSGQATHILTESGLSKSAAATLLSSDLSRFSTPLSEMTYQYKTLQRSILSARLVTVNITDPLVVSGSFRIQAIRYIRRGVTGGKYAEWFQEVTAAPWSNTLTQLLKTLGA